MVDQPPSDPQRQFCEELVQRLLRLSYWDRIHQASKAKAASLDPEGPLLVQRQRWGRGGRRPAFVVVFNTPVAPWAEQLCSCLWLLGQGRGGLTLPWVGWVSPLVHGVQEGCKL